MASLVNGAHRVTAKIAGQVFAPGNDVEIFMPVTMLTVVTLVAMLTLLIIAVAGLGALAPATWAANSRTATALRTE